MLYLQVSERKVPYFLTGILNCYEVNYSCVYAVTDKYKWDSILANYFLESQLQLS